MAAKSLSSQCPARQRVDNDVAGSAGSRGRGNGANSDWHRSDSSTLPVTGIAQAMWAFLIIVIPVLGPLAFFIVQPSDKQQ